MSEVSQIISEIENGDSTAADRLLPLVYDALRKLAAAKLANEKPGQTLQATALVHEAYVRLVGPANAVGWDSRGHFFAAAAEAMRRILIDRARRRGRLKHGGDFDRVDLDDVASPSDEGESALLDLDAALTKLESLHPDKAALVKLRYFSGLTSDQAAQSLGISPATADRHWAYARAWLYRELGTSRDG
jgi:RNA polymerase sigma factor (TIGR02999 family)